MLLMMMMMLFIYADFPASWTTSRWSRRRQRPFGIVFLASVAPAAAADAGVGV